MKPDVSTDTFWNTRIVRHNNNKHMNSARKFPGDTANFQKISRIFRRKNNSGRFPGFPGVSHTLQLASARKWRDAQSSRDSHHVDCHQKWNQAGEQCGNLSYQPCEMDWVCQKAPPAVGDWQCAACWWPTSTHRTVSAVDLTSHCRQSHTHPLTS